MDNKKDQPAVPDAIHDSAMSTGSTELVEMPGHMRLGTLFNGEEFAVVRQSLIDKGEYVTSKNVTKAVLRKREDGDYDILSLATVSRSPGRSDTYLDTIEDYEPITGNRAQEVERYWNIYLNEGIINNATNKIAAILGGKGSFKVRKAKKGKKRKPEQELEEILFQWSRLVNAGVASPLTTGRGMQPGVITGSRGLTALNHQAVRFALVEGSWIGRDTWAQQELRGLGVFTLPMTIQTISTANLVPVEELLGTGIELFIWKPPNTFVEQIRRPKTPEIKKLIDKYIPSKIRNELKKKGEYLLDPALLMHVKHRGKDTEPFGESFIRPAMPALAYSQSLLRLDVTSMQNLINRLTIVMVGADEGPYSKEDVMQARQTLMDSLFQDPGPNMTIIWAGQDVKVEDVGAHSSVLELDERFKGAEARVKVSLGVPDALLSGTTTDGKSAGWAATVGASAQLEELADSFSTVWTTLAERIAIENGFEDLDIVWQWDQSLIADKIAERNQVRNDYRVGLSTIRGALVAQGKDPDAEYKQRAFEKGLVIVDDDNPTWEVVFAPPQGLQGQGEGRPGDGDKTEPDRPEEEESPTENK